MQAQTALLFAPGLPAAGEAATVQLVHQNLHISAQGESTIVAARSCEAKAGGFDHEQLHLTWETSEGDMALVLSGADQVALLAALRELPEGTMPSLAQWRRKTSGQRWVWRSALGLIAFLAFSVVILVWQRDAAINWITWQIPRSVEERLGEQVLESFQKDRKLLDGKSPSSQAHAALQQAGDRLTAGSAYKYRWFIADDPSVNAFALPGGVIVVNSGLLLKAASADEVASVLAHEVQHVEQRHALRNMVNQASLAAVMLVVLGDVNGVVVLLAHQASAQYFSRGMESEADMLGLALLRKQKFLQEPMVSMFEKLEAANSHAEPAAPKASAPNRKDQRKDNPLGWLHSHPDVQDRIAAIKADIATNPCADCKAMAFDWPAAQSQLKPLLKRD